MRIKFQKAFLFTFSFALFVGLVGCAASGTTGSVSLIQLIKGGQPTATATQMPTATPEPPTPTATFTSTAEPSPTATPTPVMVVVNAGDELTVPILLYHHISDDNPGNRYYVPVAIFEEEIKWLYDHHYQTITVAQLADLILHGGQLPQRPVVITFDDGDEDVVTNALPIMQKYGFIGTSYLIVGWINAPGYVTSDQVASLHNAGWEIGSHTMSHIDLTQTDQVDYEVRNSKNTLNGDYGLDVKTLAYPFGLINSDVVNRTSRAGYVAAVGLGTSVTQGPGDLFYLSRMEVRQEYSMDQFIAMLPWTD